VELSVADVDGHDLTGAALEKAVDEAAGGGARVEGATIGDRHVEPLERGVELLAPAADEAGRRSLQLDRLLRGNQTRWLLGRRASDGHSTGVNGSARQLATGDQSPPHQLGVETAAQGR
jgi:hypothetical protein